MDLKINCEKTWIIKLFEPGANLAFLGCRFSTNGADTDVPSGFSTGFPVPRPVCVNVRSCAGWIGAKQAYVPIPELIGAVISPGPRMGQLLGHACSRPAFRAMNLVPSAPDGAVPETSEPVPLISYRKGSTVVRSFPLSGTGAGTATRSRASANGIGAWRAAPNYIFRYGLPASPSRGHLRYIGVLPDR